MGGGNDGLSTVIPPKAVATVIPPELERYLKNLRVSEMKTPCVYIMASKPHGTLYTGVTSDLVQRVWQHRNKVTDGFTRRYNVHSLVWYELHETMENAINREKALKKWNRAWKIKLIELTNPLWEDLYEQII